MWGHPDTVALPISDRGLSLGDGVFETVLIKAGVPQLLGEHLKRWRQGAALLQLPEPPSEQTIRHWLKEAIDRSRIVDGALRINWSRGSGGRGLTAPSAEAGRCWGTLHQHQPSFQPIAVVVSERVRRWSKDPLASCKSLNYGPQVLARQEAIQRGTDDALLLNSEGQLCCGSSANVLVLRSGRWLTPPLISGCLPGVMRARGLELGLVEAKDIEGALAFRAPAMLLNSLDCRPFNGASAGMAGQLFEDLLGSD